MQGPVPPSSTEPVASVYAGIDYVLFVLLRVTRNLAGLAGRYAHAIYEKALEEGLARLSYLTV